MTAAAARRIKLFLPRQLELDTGARPAITTSGYMTAANIEVEQLKRDEYRVRVIESNSESSHLVTLAPGDYQRLSGGQITPQQLLRHSFEFLLQREPKESILARFDLPVIARYFPEYEREMRRKLQTDSGGRRPT